MCIRFRIIPWRELRAESAPSSSFGRDYAKPARLAWLQALRLRCLP